MGFEDTLQGLMNEAGGLAQGVTGILPGLAPSEAKSGVDEPKPTPDKSKYGKVNIKELKSGITQTIDETEGNVRIVELHPSGTYDAKLDNGDQTEKVTGKKITVIDKNWEIAIFENEIVVITKDQKLHIKNDRFLNIEGNHDINIDKDKNELIKGKNTLNVTGESITKISSNERKHTTGNQTNLIEGNLDETVKGNYSSNVSGNGTSSVSGNLSISVSGNVNISASGQISITAPKISLN